MKKNLNKTLRNKLEEARSGRVMGKTLADLPQPEEMKNLISAAEMFHKAVREGKRIRIIGDYDADGIMATTVLVRGFRQVGLTEPLVDYEIPSRLRDGYGLSPNVVQRAIDDGVELIITVDNGVAAIPAIKMAKEAGLEVIVTDHHTCPSELPEADVIVCPKQPGETFPFPQISGATVAWYFLAALKRVSGWRIDLMELIDFVGITVMSDVMPLEDINLPILEAALARIRKRDRMVYQLEWAEQWRAAEEIDEIDLSFMFVPKINAMGRIDDANVAVELFTSDNRKKIFALFMKMKEVNDRRKEISRSQTLNAETYYASKQDLEHSVLVVKNKRYDEGIVGIVAGRLAEEFRKPSYVFTWNKEKKVWKGSGRSSGEINLYDLTLNAAPYLEAFGGHAGAVGLAVKNKDFDAMMKALQEAAAKIPPEKFLDKKEVPVDCSLTEIDMETFSIVREYAPYGNGNPVPVFRSEAVILEQRPIKDGLHYELLVADPDKEVTVPAMAFNVDRNILEGKQKRLPGCKLLITYTLAREFDRNKMEFQKRIFIKSIEIKE